MPVTACIDIDVSGSGARSRYDEGMDQQLAVVVFAWALWALVAIVSLLVSYWVIRLAVTPALRSHHYWMVKQQTQR